MKTIDDLLDEYADNAREYGYGLGDSTYYFTGDIHSARAAVDAEIKRMQDRISRLEAEVDGLHYSIAFQDRR